MFPCAGQTPATPTAAVGPEVTLTQCLQIALEHNAQLGIASTQFLDAKGRGIKLHAILYPTLTTQVLTTPLEAFVQVQQIFYSEATLPRLRLSRLTQEQAVINYRQTLNDVAFQVRQAFINARAAREQMDMVRDFSASKTEAIKATQQLFAAGQTPKSAVLNVQVQANSSRQFLASTELTNTQARLALETLLGQPLPANARLIGDFVTKAPAELDPQKLTATALQDREDLKLLASARLSTEQQIQIDKKDAYPEVGFGSSSAFQAPSLGFNNSFNAEANYNEPATQRAAGDSQLPYGLYAHWLFFDGGNALGIERSGQASLASRDVALAELKESISGEVTSAVAAIRIQCDLLKELNAQPSPEELRHLADLEFAAGRLRQLDKVNLEDDIFTQQRARLSSEVQLSLATATLDHALGRDLSWRNAPLPVLKDTSR